MPSPRLKRAMDRLSSTDGAVAIEFALVAPLFLLLVLGTMVFAIYFATFVAVIQGAAEGARASIGGMNDAERDQLARARVQILFQGYQPLLNPMRTTVNTTPIAGGGTAAPSYRVRVSYPISDFGFGFFYNFLNAVGGGSQAAPQTVSYSVTVANGGY